MRLVSLFKSARLPGVHRKRPEWDLTPTLGEDIHEVLTISWLLASLDIPNNRQLIMNISLVRDGRGSAVCQIPEKRASNLGPQGL